MKPVTFTYNPWNKAKFYRDKGHINIWVNVFSSSFKFTDVFFVFDPGAFISVLMRNSARRIGLPLTGIYSANLTGFNKDRGSDEAEIVVAPKIEIGKFILEDVKILVPLDNIKVPQVIGENILEYFSYNIDRETENIYFKKNPNPQPYIDLDKGIDLSCGRVLLQEI